MTYLWVKWIHVLASTLLFGTGLGIAFFMWLAHLRGDARVIAATARTVVIADACFTETSTIGLRWQAARRAVLPRASAGAGAVRVKTVTRPAGPSRKAESDDLAPLAGLDARRAAKRKAEES